MLTKLRALASSLIRSTPEILLIDDDILFGRILTRLAGERGVSLAHWSSLVGKDFRAIARFKLLIVDYELENTTSFQLLRCLRHHFDPPILLISAYRLLEKEPLPAGVSDFVAKCDGIETILNRALSLKNKNDR